MIFNLALKMADLENTNVWYAGDSQVCDVAGANNAGIFLVWYISVYEEMDQEYAHIKCLEIHHWAELIEVLRQMV